MCWGSNSEPLLDIYLSIELPPPLFIVNSFLFQVFNTRIFKIKERHLFLTYLGKVQYDPAKPNYVSLDKFVSVPDEVFCKEIAKASVKDFEKFLKTL